MRPRALLAREACEELGSSPASPARTYTLHNYLTIKIVKLEGNVKKTCRFHTIVLVLGVMGSLTACSAGPDDDITVFDDTALDEANRLTQHVPVDGDPESEADEEDADEEDADSPEPLYYPAVVGDDERLDAERVPTRAAPGE